MSSHTINQIESNTKTSASRGSPSSAKTLPGDLAMWFFILAELTVFAILFIAFAITKQLKPELFELGQASLHPLAGLINTLALIASSYFVVLAINAIKNGQVKQTQLHFIIAIVVACIYIVSKSWEYLALFELGIGLSTSTFYTLYFLITAFHFMHVLLGMVILLLVVFKLKQVNNDKHEALNTAESAASYWHMVDLVWIMLFPLIYII